MIAVIQFHLHDDKYHKISVPPFGGTLSLRFYLVFLSKQFIAQRFAV